MFKYLVLMLFPWLLGANEWAVYYSDKAEAKEFKPYSLLVFDSIYHPPMQELLEENKTILGYLSLGEIAETDPFYAKAKEANLLLTKNPNWDGFYVDVRNPAWAKIVIEDIVPSILFKKFSGVFLDTVDNPIFLEPQYPGMTEALVKLIKGIRLHYPQIKIMMNRGFEILPEVAKQINMELLESVMTDYDFKTKTYHRRPTEEYQEILEKVKEAKKINPSLKIYTLDYWSKDDAEAIKEIYRMQRSHGFVPYVSTINLDEIIPQPK